MYRIIYLEEEMMPESVEADFNSIPLSIVNWDNQLNLNEPFLGAAMMAISGMEKYVDRDKTDRYERNYYPFRPYREEEDEYGCI